MTDEARKKKQDLHSRAVELIVAERAKKGLTQAQLAVAASMAPATVSNLERGSPVSRSTIDKLAAQLDLADEVAAIFGEVAHG